jgi:mannosyltransferase OCH1-like enzyme
MKNYCKIWREYKSMDRFLKHIFNSPHEKIRLIHPSLHKKRLYENRHIKNLIEDGMVIQRDIASSTFYMLTRKGRLKHMEGGYWSEFMFNQFYKWMKRFFAFVIILGTMVGMFWTYCELWQPQWIPKYKQSTPSIEIKKEGTCSCQK